MANKKGDRGEKGNKKAQEGQKTGKKVSSEAQEQLIEEFRELVNLTPQELQKWLTTEESNSVGQKKDDDESIGHKSGKQILEILDKNKSDYIEEDFEQMKRVVSYVRRHLAQKPSSDIEHSRWRYSLMNWGHDPLK
jgi:hypothetical protein